MSKPGTSNIEQADSQSGAEASTSHGGGARPRTSTGKPKKDKPKPRKLTKLKDMMKTIECQPGELSLLGPLTTEKELKSEQERRVRLLEEIIWYKEWIWNAPAKDNRVMYYPRLINTKEGLFGESTSNFIHDPNFYTQFLPKKYSCECDSKWGSICYDCYSIKDNPNEEEISQWYNNVCEAFGHLYRPGELYNHIISFTDRIAMLYDKLLEIKQEGILQAGDQMWLIVNVIRIIHYQWVSQGKQNINLFFHVEAKKLFKNLKKINNSGSMSNKLTLYYGQFVGNFVISFLSLSKNAEGSAEESPGRMRREDNKMGIQGGAEASTSYGRVAIPRTFPAELVAVEPYREEQDRDETDQEDPNPEEPDRDKPDQELSTVLERFQGIKNRSEQSMSIFKKLKKALLSKWKKGPKKYKSCADFKQNEDMKRLQYFEHLEGPYFHSEFLPTKLDCKCTCTPTLGCICDACYKSNINKNPENGMAVKDWCDKVVLALFYLPLHPDIEETHVPLGNVFYPEEIKLLHNEVEELYQLRIIKDTKDHLMFNVVRIMHRYWDSVGVSLFTELEPLRLLKNTEAMKNMETIEESRAMYENLRLYYERFVGRYVLYWHNENEM